MHSLSILVLAAGLASAAPAPTASTSTSSGSICHVLTYTGSCGNLTSVSNSSSPSSSSAPASSSTSCRYSNVCLVPSMPNATLLEDSINANTGIAFLARGSNETFSSNSNTTYVNATGFVDLAFSGAGVLSMPAQGVCDGERYLVNGTDMAYQCICNDIPDSCPDAGGAAVSISYANGTSSTSAVPANAGPSEFSWTWTPTPSGTGAGVKIVVNGSQTTIKGVDSPPPTARTTFVGTFGSPAPTSAAQSSSVSGGIAPGAAASGDKSGGAHNSRSVTNTCALLVGFAGMALVWT